MCNIIGHIRVPAFAFRLCFYRPLCGRLISGQAFYQRYQAKFRITDHGQGLMLCRIMTTDVQGHKLRVLGKRCPGTRGEILQAGSDGNDDIGFCCNCICRVRTGHTYRPDVKRMRIDQVGPSGNGLNNRYRVGLGERAQFVDCARVLHTATGNDHGAFRRPYPRKRIIKLMGIG